MGLPFVASMILYFSVYDPEHAGTEEAVGRRSAHECQDPTEFHTMLTAQIQAACRGEWSKC